MFFFLLFQLPLIGCCCSVVLTCKRANELRILGMRYIYICIHVYIIYTYIIYTFVVAFVQQQFYAKSIITCGLVDHRSRDGILMAAIAHIETAINLATTTATTFAYTCKYITTHTCGCQKWTAGYEWYTAFIVYMPSKYNHPKNYIFLKQTRPSVIKYCCLQQEMIYTYVHKQILYIINFPYPIYLDYIWLCVAEWINISLGFWSQYCLWLVHKLLIWCTYVYTY